MENYFERVKNYLLELECTIVSEDEENGTIIIENEDGLIKNMFLTVSDPILIMEQYILEIKNPEQDIYKKLLQKNQDIVHGAFAIDESGDRVTFIDTLELENLDMNELQGSLNSLTLLLSEYGDELLKFAKV